MSSIKIHRITADDSWEMMWKGWELARVNYPLALIISILFFVGTILGSIPFVGPLIAGVVTTLAPLVFLEASRLWENGEKGDFQTVMKVFENKDRLNALTPLLLIQLVISAGPGLLAMLPFLGAVVGLLSLITIPISIIVSLSIPILFFNYLYEDMDYKRALSWAVEGIVQNFVAFIVLVLLVCVLSVICLIPLGLGIIFVAFPIYITIGYLWYRSVYEGLQFEKDKEKSLI